MTRFTEAEFTAAMEAAVAERGKDWVYPRTWYYEGVCSYSLEDGTPACLIGVALSKLDPGLVPDFGERASAEIVLEDLVPEPVAIAAREAQVHQDNGHIWGSALQVYKRYLEKNS